MSSEALEKVRAALNFYAVHGAGCRKLSSAGEPSRNELDRDGGNIAEEALVVIDALQSQAAPAEWEPKPYGDGAENLSLRETVNAAMKWLGAKHRRHFESEDGDAADLIEWLYQRHSTTRPAAPAAQSGRVGEPCFQIPASLFKDAFMGWVSYIDHEHGYNVTLRYPTMSQAQAMHSAILANAPKTLSALSDTDSAHPLYLAAPASESGQQVKSQRG